MTVAYRQPVCVAAVTEKGPGSMHLRSRGEADVHITATAMPSVFVGFATQERAANVEANPGMLTVLAKPLAAGGSARSTGNPL
jgi:hypothetical protein